MNVRLTISPDSILEDAVESDEDYREESAYETANNSLTSSPSLSMNGRERKCNLVARKCWPDPTPPEYNEGLFCRRKGVPLPKRSACSVFFGLYDF